MNDISVAVITQSSELPELDSSNFFHSPELFLMIERTSGLSPCMVVARRADGQIAAHMLAMLRRRGSLIPPYLFSQGRVYGEGVYAPDTDREMLFGMMLHEITKFLHRRMCLYIEFSDLGKKMFGYRAFRQSHYFPVAWMQIHNSLHSMEPRLRLDEKTLRRISHAYEAGIETRRAQNSKETHAVYKLLKSYYRLRFQRYVPKEPFFQLIADSRQGDIFITAFKGRIIGGSAVVYSQGDAYLWFEASRKKSHPFLHPDLLTTWQAIKESHADGYGHIKFMNVGLPFRRNAYRDFILNFGGKPVSTYRWFHFTFNWMNRVCSWLFSE